MSFAQRRFSSAQPPASCALLGCRAVLKSRISQTAAHFLAPKIAHCSSCGSFCRISASRSARNETSAALATPGKAELVVGPVLLGILGIFAVATGLAANVVLLGLPGCIALSRGSCGFTYSIRCSICATVIADIIIVISDVAKPFRQTFSNFFPHPFSFSPDPHLGFRATIPPCPWHHLWRNSRNWQPARPGR